MKTFKELGITSETKGLIGDKIKIERVFNREIIVEDYRIGPSKYGGEYLTLQIRIGEIQHVVFTGSTGLIDLIQKIGKENLPIKTTIENGSDDKYKFT